MPNRAVTQIRLADSRRVVSSGARIAKRLTPRQPASRIPVKMQISRLFGNSPEFWLNAQRAVDLWDAAQILKEDLERIKPLRVA